MISAFDLDPAMKYLHVNVSGLFDLIHIICLISLTNLLLRCLSSRNVKLIFQNAFLDRGLIDALSTGLRQSLSR